MPHTWASKKINLWGKKLLRKNAFFNTEDIGKPTNYVEMQRHKMSYFQATSNRLASSYANLNIISSANVNK